MSDTALSELAPLLKEIVKKQVNDVRDALRKFRDQMLEQISKGIQNPQLSLDWAYSPDKPRARQSQEEF